MISKTLEHVTISISTGERERRKATPLPTLRPRHYETPTVTDSEFRHIFLKKASVPLETLFHAAKETSADPDGQDDYVRRNREPLRGDFPLPSTSKRRPCILKLKYIQQGKNKKQK